MNPSPQIVFVAGARPNFMKVAPILRRMKSHGAPFSCSLVHTGQHYDASMSEVFFEQLGIPRPDHHLNAGSGSHGVQTARVLAAFEEYLESLHPRPRGVVVVGDVNSTMAAALAAVKLHVPVAHVEAGLRSFDRAMPEEINRIVTDAVADLLLVSEPSGTENLRREGIPAERVVFVGNVMIDTLFRELSAARALDVGQMFEVRGPTIALVTLHRPSNVDEPDRLAALVGFLERLATKAHVVFPVHPRTGKRLAEHNLDVRLRGCGGLRLCDPLGYHENIAVMAASALVITDSGGVQEETSYLGVPCLTFRPNTERPVTVTEGTNTVVGDDLQFASQLVDDILEGRYKTGRPIHLWDGHAAERVVDALKARWAGDTKGKP